MKDDLVGKLIAVNSFNLRATPGLSDGGHDAGATERDAPPSAHQGRRRARRRRVARARRAVGGRKRRQPAASSRRTRSPRSDAVLDRVAGLVHDQEDGRVAGPAYQPRRNTRSARRWSSSARTSRTISSRTSNPIGRQLRIQSIPYTVVGVAEKQGSVFGISLDKFVLAPEKSPLNRWVNPHGVIDAMIIQGPDDAGDAAGDGERARRDARAPPSASVAARQLRARDVRHGARVLEQAAGLSRHGRHRAADGRAWWSAPS